MCIVVLQCILLVGSDLSHSTGCSLNPELLLFKVAVKACDHEITRYIKAYLIQTRSTDGNKLYIK